MDQPHTPSTAQDNAWFELLVDAQSRISHVNEAWLRFGRENQLPEGQILGRSILDFISDPATHHFYAELMARVRHSERSASFPFRCDSPTVRRFMEMHMHPLSGCGVAFRSRIIRAVARPYVALLDPALPRSDQFIRMCAWCKHVAIPDWVEVERALQLTRWFDQPRLPQLTHGICPACEAQMNAKIGGWPKA